VQVARVPAARPTNFVAEFSDCSFNIHLVDDEIAFQPSAGAEQVALKPAVTPAPAKEGGK